MLRITVDENPETVVIKLEGRVAGPWAAELGRLWEEKAPVVAKKKLASICEKPHLPMPRECGY